MIRLSYLLLGAGLAAGVPAQDIPGVKATLSVPRSVVGVAGTVDIRLAIEVTADASVPAALLSGTMLEVSVDDKAGPKIAEAGKGGEVALVKGTRIVRTISVPATRFVPNAAGAGFSTVAVQWTGLPGARSA